ncbi:MAG: hypothetical protein ABI282_00725 [Candidatus Baltobacteraceae bacterium]
MIVVVALIVSACGRQVTPDRPGTNGSGLPSGYMSTKFRVAQPFDFSTYSYIVVFNTTGNGATPRANATQTNYRGYSFAIMVSGAGGSVTATLYQYYTPPNATAPTLVPLQYTPQQLQFYLNTNGQNTEFTLTFQRNLFFGINNTPNPTSTPSVAASTTPSPSTSPSVSPSASPTAVPSGAPQNIWTFNYFVASGTVGQGNLLPVDSLGAIPTGGTDTTYTSPNLDTTTSFDITIVPSVGSHPPVGPSLIQGGEIANNP